MLKGVIEGILAVAIITIASILYVDSVKIKAEIVDLVKENKIIKFQLNKITNALENAKNITRRAEGKQGLTGPRGLKGGRCQHTFRLTSFFKPLSWIQYPVQAH